MKLLVASLLQLEKQRDSSSALDFRLMDTAPLKEFAIAVPKDMNHCF